MDYSFLRSIQKKEMESSALVDLPDDFYSTMAALLAKKKEEALSSRSLLAMREFDNIKKIIRAISAKREEKIVLITIRGEGETNGLTSEEKQMLKDLSSIIKKSRETVKTAWESEKESRADSRKVRVLKDVERYRGLDNSIYGPFKEGEEQDLPLSEAEWLVKAGMAKML